MLGAKALESKFRSLMPTLETGRVAFIYNQTPVVGQRQVSPVGFLTSRSPVLSFCFIKRTCSKTKVRKIDINFWLPDAYAQQCVRVPLPPTGAQLCTPHT